MQTGVRVQVGACEACRVVEAIGEPPAGVPARAAVRVGRHVEVEIKRGEERVIEVKQRGRSRQAVELAVDH